MWVIGDGNKAEQRRVQLGQSTPETAVIASGLQENETVVVDGVQRVRPGVVVAPGPAAPEPSMGGNPPPAAAPPAAGGAPAPTGTSSGAKN